MLLITGAKGQLGKCLADIINPSEVCLCDIADLDITDMDAVHKFAKGKDFEAVINCAAFTNVERSEADRENVHKVNAVGPKNLAILAADRNIPIVQLSTDYVFGNSCFPLNEESKPEPLSVYGQTKLEGEDAVKKEASQYVIIRTSWLHSRYGSNFVKTVLKLVAQRKEIKVVCDQIGTPTFAEDLAKTILIILARKTEGIKEVYHFSNEGVASWYDFAHEIVRRKAPWCTVTPIKTEEYQSKAKRPLFSVLDKAKIKKDFNISIDHWSVGVEKCLKQLSKG